MYLSDVNDPFYETTARELWGDQIRPPLLSLKQLDKELEEGRKKWIELHPPKSGWAKYKGLATFALVAASAGAASMAMGATAGAGAGAGITGAATAGASVGAAGAAGAAAGALNYGAIAAAGAASGATGGALSSSSMMSMIKSGASYLNKGAALYSKVTGKETPAELMAAADAIENSESFVEAGEKAFHYYVNQTGQKVVDEQQRAMIRERLERERALQAERLRKLAAQKAEQQAGRGLVSYLPVLIPAGIVLIGAL